MSASATSPRPRRSFIFTPGLRPEMYPKALASGADIVCVELEDGIAPRDKAAARTSAMALFAEPQAEDDVERMVRINSLREAFGLADLQAVLAADTPPPALMLPKVRSPEEVALIDDLLTEPGHPTCLHVIAETNRALEAAPEIARCSDRIDALFFGGVDMAADLRCENAWEPLLHARSRVVHAAASAGLDVIDGKLIEKRVLREMYRILAIADRMAARAWPSFPFRRRTSAAAADAGPFGHGPVSRPDDCSLRGSGGARLAMRSGRAGDPFGAASGRLEMSSELGQAFAMRLAFGDRELDFATRTRRRGGACRAAGLRGAGVPCAATPRGRPRATTGATGA